MKTFFVNSIIEQHIHGGFGVDFNTCSVEDVFYFLKNIRNYGVSKVYPTLHTDNIDVMNNQLKVLFEASKINSDVKIMGVHLEGPFINPQKAGVHSSDIIKKPNLKDYKRIIDGVDEDFVKIVTLAPELDENGELIDYLNQKGVVVSAGHTLTDDLKNVSQVTHLFNAMGGISHKMNSTATMALCDDNIYTEVIADGNHIVDEVLKLVFKIKPKDKIILISDALPIAHSDNNVEKFMGKDIYLNGSCAKTKDGVLAGCAVFVFDIIKRLVKNEILDPEDAFLMASKNIAEHLNIGHASMLEIDENFNILDIQ